MGEFIANLQMGEEVREANTENTSVWLHVGHLAVYDHIYITVDEARVAYVWNDESHYQALLKAAIAAKAEIHANMREAAERDVDAYMRHHTEDLGDTVPDNWT